MESYLRFVLPYVPGCPEVLAETKILEAARALCDDAFCWRKKQASTVLANAVSLALDLDPEAEVSDVPAYSRDGRNSLDYEISGTNLIIPAFSADSEVKLTIAQRPLLTSESLPAEFKTIRYHKVSEALAEMAKAILHGMTGQPWFDPRQAQAEKTYYDLYVGQIRSQILRPNPMTEMRVTPRRFI